MLYKVYHKVSKVSELLFFSISSKSFSLNAHYTTMNKQEAFMNSTVNQAVKSVFSDYNL